MGIDPVTLAIASAAFQGFSAIRSYQQQNKASKNAMRAAEEEGRILREDASKRALAEKQDAARVRAQQIAAYMKSGVTLDGSPLLVSSETTEQGERNAANVMSNAESQASLLRNRAKSVQRGDFFGTAASALGSASNAYSAYDNRYGNINWST